MEAKAVVAAVSVISSYKLEGALWVEVPCSGYEALEALPAALEYEGKVCGRTGWNSDRGVAYYSSSRKVAKGVA
jgi:hypothetical protein